MISESPPHLERSFDILSPQAAALAHDPASASDDLSQSDHASTHPSVDVAQRLVQGSDALTDPHFFLTFAVWPTVGTYDLRSQAEYAWVVLSETTRS